MAGGGLICKVGTVLRVVILKGIMAYCLHVGKTRMGVGMLRASQAPWVLKLVVGLGAVLCTAEAVMKASFSNRYRRFLSRSGSLVSGLGLCVVLLWAGGLVWADGGAGIAPQPPEPKVQFLLDTVGMRPGETAELTLSVSSNIELKRISVAINFDETKFRIESAERILEMAPLPNDITTTEMDNRDDSPGEQATEGWIHLELTASALAGELQWPLGEEVPLYRFKFRSVSNAAYGLSPVGFTTVGSEDGLAVLENSAELKDPPVDVAGVLAVPRECLTDGGIILGLGEIGFFLRGDSNVDGVRDISDAINSLSFLFQGGKDVLCEDAADSNDDGLIDMSDPVFTLYALYQSGEPHPEPDVWGPDPTQDRLCCEVTGGCSS